MKPLSSHQPTFIWSLSLAYVDHSNPADHLYSRLGDEKLVSKYTIDENSLAIVLETLPVFFRPNIFVLLDIFSNIA